MKISDLLSNFPAKRLKTIDGMAVTASVWEEAHEFHRRSQQFENLLQHGWGVASGLNVIASDPADTSVYITPGVAIDRNGNIIVLPQPVSYEIGEEMEGKIYLSIVYEESTPRAEAAEEKAGAPLYIRSEFAVLARTVPPAGAAIELARVQRAKRTAVFHNASDSHRPVENEIDLRYRREIGAFWEATASVCYLGDFDARVHGFGLDQVARSLSATGRAYVSIANDVPLAPGIETSTLVYFVGQGSFELSPGQIAGLSNYIKKGKGTILVEPMDSQASDCFRQIFAAMDLRLEALTFGHPLLKEPNLFAFAPPGSIIDVQPVAVSDGVIFSANQYGRLWQGVGRPSREAIRSGIEWGQNIVTYAFKRRGRL